MSARPRIFCVVAARPNLMKIAPILAEIETQGGLEGVLVHTGQHYDENMSDVFFRDLNIPDPDIHLGIGSGTHAEQTGKLMIAFEKLCMEDRPDMVLVVGDVNATVACSLVATKLHIPVAHVEAGLRSRDRRMPEEINRVITDALSDLLFTTCRDADENLAREGIDPARIHFTGNVMVDTLLKHKGKIDAASAVTEVLGAEFLDKGYALLTIHRPSNVDERTILEGWVNAFEEIAREISIVCPLHPRTRKRLEEFGLIDRFFSVTTTIKPLGYLQFVALMQKSRLIITDSGGLQEEATMLQIPCLTIRETTERPITITHGTNQLVGTDPGQLVAAVQATLDRKSSGRGEYPELWDGRAAARIVRVLRAYWS